MFCLVQNIIYRNYIKSIHQTIYRKHIMLSSIYYYYTYIISNVYLHDLRHVNYTGCII